MWTSQFPIYSFIYSWCVIHQAFFLLRPSRFFVPLTLMKSGFSAAVAAAASAEIPAIEFVLLASLCAFVEDWTSSTRVISVELATEQTLPFIVSVVVVPAAHSNPSFAPSNICRFVPIPPYQYVSKLPIIESSMAMAKFSGSLASAASRSSQSPFAR